MKKVLIIALTAAFLLSLSMSGCSSEKGVGETGINQAEFNEIQLGMSLSEVEHIFRGDKKSEAMTKISEKDNSTEEMYEHVVVYKVLGEKTGYAELEITYSNKLKGSDFPKNKLTAKTQHNLS